MQINMGSFWNRVATLTLIYLVLMMLLAWFLISGVARTWAFDLTDNEEFRGTAGIYWQHYDPLGVLTSNVRVDTDTGNFRQLGVGHYFDAIDGGVNVNANRARGDSQWQWGFSINKRFFDNYRLGFAYQPLTGENVYSLSGQVFDRVYLHAQYSDYYDSWNLRGSTPLWQGCRLTSGIRQNTGGAWEADAGLTVRFTTGTRVRRSKVQEKQIEWIATAKALGVGVGTVSRDLGNVPDGTKPEPKPAQDVDESEPVVPDGTPAPVPRVIEHLVQLAAYRDPGEAKALAEKHNGWVERYQDWFRVRVRVTEQQLATLSDAWVID